MTALRPSRLRPRRPRRPVRTRARGDRGASLAEFGIIAPVLALLVFGALEAGFALQDSNLLSRSAQQAARTGSTLADDEFADYEVLRSVDAFLSGLKASDVRRVIVYDGGAEPDAAPPPACLDAVRPDDTSVVGVSGLCNVYSATQVATDAPAAFSGSCVGTWDANYCPGDRVRTGATPDRLGVYIELDLATKTGFFPGSLTLRRQAVFQLEPCVGGDASC